MLWNLQAGMRPHRLGGEEFMLLLRGDDAALEAERRRPAIPKCIANSVPELDRLVTASMGVTHLTEQECFATTYQRADMLPYEAKNRGRDCTRSSMGWRQGADDFSKQVARA